MTGYSAAAAAAEQSCTYLNVTRIVMRCFCVAKRL